MNLRIVPFSSEYLDGIRALNRQLDTAEVNLGLRLPERWANPSQAPFGSAPESPFEERQFLVMDGEEVVGGFMLQEQGFHLSGRVERVTNIQAPISLGVVNRKYATLGGWMVRSVLAQRPLLFALGMGSMEMPFPRLLKAMRWHIEPVPFQFRVLRASRFLREIQALRRDPIREWGSRIAALSGAGWLGLGLAQRARGLHARRGRQIAALKAVQVTSWDEWTDEIWDVYRGQCSLAGARDRATMDLFQPLQGRLRAYQLFEPGGRLVGWASLQTRRMENSPHFGNLVVNTVLDSACIPGWEMSAIRAVTQISAGDGADVIVTNQQHKRWLEAFRASGYLNGPSNYLLAMSPALTRELEPLAENLGSAHISRADADGRWQL
jgi:hypothetical protein